jgi:hypothetical protein
VLLGLLVVARRPVDLAEAEVAVGEEGMHAELAPDRERIAVVGLGLPATARRRDVAGEARAWASLARAPRRRVSVRASWAWLAASSIRPAERQVIPARRKTKAGRT